jgi:hypothetical protein
MSREQAAQQVAVPARDVTPASHVGEVAPREGLHDELRLDGRVARHGLVEHVAVGGVHLGVLEGHHAELAHEGILFAVADHRREVLPQGVVLGTLRQQRHRAEGPGVIRAEQRPRVGEPESACLVFGQQPQGAEGPQQAVGHRRVGAERGGRRLGRPRLRGGEVIEHAQVGAGEEDLTAPSPEDEVDDPARHVRIHRLPAFRRVSGAASRVRSISPSNRPRIGRLLPMRPGPRRIGTSSALATEQPHQRFVITHLRAG